MHQPACLRLSLSRRCTTLMARLLRVFMVVPLMVLTLLLTGCQVEIYQGLTESQANSMLATLLKNGIDAQKASAGKTGFTLSVDEKQLIQALEILKDNSLPREEFKSLGTVFSGQGMIASPTEEQARMAYALSQELSDTFSRIDGVLSSRVHVVLAATDQASDTRTPPSAAVFLRHTPESQVVSLVPKIRELTANAVPGLAFDHVTVMLVPLREPVGVPMRSQPTFLGLPLAADGGPPYLLLGLGIALFAVFLGLLVMGVLLIRKSLTNPES